MNHLLLTFVVGIFLFGCSAPQQDGMQTKHEPPTDLEYLDTVSFQDGRIVNGSRCSPMGPSSLYQDERLSNRLATVQLGDTVYVLQTMDKDQAKGKWRVPVYQVEWMHKGKRTLGYMPQYALCTQRLEVDPAHTLLLTISDLSKEDGTYLNPFFTALLVDRRHAVLDRLSFPCDFTVDELDNGDLHFGYSLLLQKLPSYGLKGVRNTFALQGDYGACGYVNGSYYFFWDGKHLYPGIGSYGMGDSGLLSQSNTLVFPADSNGYAEGIDSYAVSKNFGEDGSLQGYDSLVTRYTWSSGALVLQDTLVQYTMPVPLSSDSLPH